MLNFIKVFLDCVLVILVMNIFEENVISDKIRDKIASISIMFLSCCFVNFISISEKMTVESINLLITFIAVFILTKLPIKTFLIVYTISLLISGITEAIVYFLIPCQNYLVLDKIISIIVIIILRIVVLSMRKKSFSVISLPKNLVFILGLLLGSVLVLLVGISVHMNLNETGASRCLFIAALIAGITVCVCTIEGIRLGNTKIDLQKKNEILQDYSKQQKKYYELLLKNEEDTRRFRHDLLNHLQCINGLLDESNTDACKKYISDITNTIGKSQKIYCTGNQIADIILASSLSKLQKDTEVKVSGHLKDNINISDYDFCVIISNLIDNAVEAVNTQNILNPFIKITFTTGKRFIKIDVKNSLSSEQIVSALKLQTKKANRKLHGLGLHNVKLVVGKYNGTMEYDVQNNEFHVYIQLDMFNGKSP